MSDRLIALLLPLSPRERGLLGVMVLFVLPLAVVFGLLLPLAERKHTAAEARDQAIALHSWVQDRAAEAATLPQPATRGDTGPLGLAGIEQSLIEANLRPAVTSLGARGAGGVELVFERVDFLRLASWMSANHPGWGYDPVSYRFEATDQPGTVSAALILMPQ